MTPPHTHTFTLALTHPTRSPRPRPKLGREQVRASRLLVWAGLAAWFRLFHPFFLRWEHKGASCSPLFLLSPSSLPSPFFPLFLCVCLPLTPSLPLFTPLSASALCLCLLLTPSPSPTRSPTRSPAPRRSACRCPPPGRPRRASRSAGRSRGSPSCSPR